MIFMQSDGNGPIVAFTLARYSGRASVHALSHLVFDRFPLTFTPGLHFWRSLGVGQGRVFDPHADLQRYALFTVWDSYEALKQFESSSAIVRSMQSQAQEVWTVHMRPVRWHGKWGGRDPLAAMVREDPPPEGPWIILTRATIRPTRLGAFLRAVPPVAEQMLQQKDLINSVGVGEAPLLFQATLSVWRTLPSITNSAYSHNQQHSDVVRRTRQEGWYREELFARFRPLASTGTWDGVNPLL